ncbi:hypothetical protein HKX48_003530 [Thoreauomyces humboldtii]|nr:hypothetical protein HKX48_003530 [Thoreauomyces humboldtii]
MSLYQIICQILNASDTEEVDDQRRTSSLITISTTAITTTFTPVRTHTLVNAQSPSSNTTTTTIGSRTRNQRPSSSSARAQASTGKKRKRTSDTAEEAINRASEANDNDHDHDVEDQAERPHPAAPEPSENGDDPSLWVAGDAFSVPMAERIKKRARSAATRKRTLEVPVYSQRKERKPPRGIRKRARNTRESAQEEPEKGDPPEFEVENILDVRYSYANRGPKRTEQISGLITRDTIVPYEFFVSWKGYPIEDATWEPSGNLMHLEVVDAFFAGRERK